MKIVLDNGFLDERLDGCVKNFRKENSKYYNIVFKFNKLAYDIENYLTISNPSTADLFIFATFIQIHKSFQSFITLMERGMLDESQIILRNMYEKLFKMKFVIEDKDNFKYLYQEHYINSKSLYNYIKQENLYSFMSKSKVKKGLDKINNELKSYCGTKDIKSLKTFEIVNKINMKKEYVFYKVLCNNVHFDLSTLENVISEKGNNIFIDSGLKFNDILWEVAKSLDCFSCSIENFIDYMKLDNFKDGFSDCYNEFENMIKK